jgi:hypothetical protein
VVTYIISLIFGLLVGILVTTRATHLENGPTPKIVPIMDGRTNVTTFQKPIRATPDTKFIRSIFSISENPVTNLTFLSSEEEIGDGFVNQSQRGIGFSFSFSFSRDQPSLESKWSMIIIHEQLQHVLFVMK